MGSRGVPRELQRNPTGSRGNPWDLSGFHVNAAIYHGLPWDPARRPTGRRTGPMERPVGTRENTIIVTYDALPCVRQYSVGVARNSRNKIFATTAVSLCALVVGGR